MRKPGLFLHEIRRLIDLQISCSDRYGATRMVPRMEM